MALIKCVECGQDVSDKAQMCMNCGCPVSEILKMMGEEADILLQESKKINLSVTIQELYEQGKISRAICGALCSNGVGTLQELVNCSEEKVAKFRRLGRRNYLRLVEFVNEMGLNFADP